MTYRPTDVFNPKLDIEIEHVVDVPPALVWKAWTVPKHLMPWFCPKPWLTVECTIDLRPGGEFSTTMQSPEGAKFPGTGCYLEVIESQRLVWTNVLGPGFRPAPHNAEPPGIAFTGIVMLSPEGKGTRYKARALHHNEAAFKQHSDMGFVEGWGTALRQLVEYIKTV
jgi:uncharacterized protein YndB with AHSA1/START domain